MEYNRTFEFAAAHFSDDAAPNAIFEAVEFRRFDQLLQCARSIHGHNFKVVVSISTEEDFLNWFVDDVEISKAVMQFQSKNFSLVPELFEKKKRATTENICRLITSELRKVVPLKFEMSVRVYENESIYASLFSPSE